MMFLLLVLIILIVIDPRMKQREKNRILYRNKIMDKLKGKRIYSIIIIIIIKVTTIIKIMEKTKKQLKGRHIRIVCWSIERNWKEIKKFHHPIRNLIK